MASDNNEKELQTNAEKQLKEETDEQAGAETGGDQLTGPEEPEQLSSSKAESGYEANKPATPCAEEESNEDCDPAQGMKQVRMQSLLAQVRKQIRAQVGVDFHRGGILDVIQRVARGELDKGGDGGLEETNQAVSGVMEEDDCSSSQQDCEEGAEVAALREELQASAELLRKEFKLEIAQLRTEMQAYCDNAMKTLESKLLVTTRSTDPWKTMLQKINHPGEHPHPSGRSLENKHKSLSVPSLVPGRNRVLNRTMTTITPQTALMATLGPRSKSDTLGSTKEKYSSLLLLESPDFHVLASHSTKLSKATGLPSACPPNIGNTVKLIRNKARLGSSITKYP